MVEVFHLLFLFLNDRLPDIFVLELRLELLHVHVGAPLVVEHVPVVLLVV
jgi:hypothetical protein